MCVWPRECGSGDGGMDKRVAGAASSGRCEAQIAPRFFLNLRLSISTSTANPIAT
jgi:hypothetical protein